MLRIESNACIAVSIIPYEKTCHSACLDQFRASGPVPPSFIASLTLIIVSAADSRVLHCLSETGLSTAHKASDAGTISNSMDSFTLLEETVLDSSSTLEEQLTMQRNKQQINNLILSRIVPDLALIKNYDKTMLNLCTQP